MKPLPGRATEVEPTRRAYPFSTCPPDRRPPCPRSDPGWDRSSPAPTSKHPTSHDRRPLRLSSSRLRLLFQRTRPSGTRKGDLDSNRSSVFRADHSHRRCCRLRPDPSDCGTVQGRGLRRHRIQERVRRRRLQHRPVRSADAKLTSCTLFEAKSLNFAFEQSDNPYWVKKDGAIKTVSVEFVGPAPRSEESDP